MRSTTDASNARRKFTTFRNPEPTTVTTINRVVVKIILTEMLGPPRLAIASALMSWPRALVVFMGDGPARVDSIPDRVQTGLERDRRQLFHHRHGASNRRFQPRFFCPFASGRGPWAQGEALLRGAGAEHLRQRVHRPAMLGR